MVTGHVDRFKRWGSTKVNKILTIIDTVFWFALFIIAILGTSSSHSTSSRALGAIIIILALVLWYVTSTPPFSRLEPDRILLSALDCIQSYICIRIRKYFKLYGVLPDEGAMKSSGSV